MIKNIKVVSLSIFLSFLVFSSQSNAQIIIKNELPSFHGPAIGVIPQSGDLGVSYPIKTIEGINNIQPYLTLFYHSGLRNGPLGVGWSIPIDYIEINTKYGVPKYDGSEKYVLMMSGAASELIFDASTQTYRTEIENSFLKIEKLGDNSWKVTDKKGVVYTFGKTDDSKIYDRTTSTKTFRWSINKVQDLLGNTMTFSYRVIGNQIYPKTIDYTSNPNKPLDAFATVEFELGPRTTSFYSYAQGFKVETTQVIKKILIKALGNIERQYELGYSASSNTKRDLLTSVTEKDKDGNAFLPTQFSYYGDVKSFSSVAGSIPSDAQFSSSGGDLGVRIADVNSDGYPDMIRSFYEVNALSNPPFQRKTEQVFINNKSNGWTLDSRAVAGQCSDTFCAPFIAKITENAIINNQITPITNYIDAGARMVDANGDGREDVIQAMKEVGVLNGQVQERPPHLGAFLNNGNGWGSDQGNWRLNGDELLNFFFVFVNQNGNSIQFGVRRQFLGTVFSDVNNDGLVDFITSNRRTSSTNIFNVIEPSRKTYLNNGSGWTENGNWVPPSSNADFSDGATLVDLNGDFLPDIFYRKSGSPRIFMNVGNGWQDDASSPWLNTFGLGDLTDGSTQFADINGDGLEDMIIAKGSFGNGSRILINTGSGWFQDDNLVISGPNFQNVGTRLLDANADTMLDYMINDGSTKTLHLNGGDPADLLSQIVNGNGGKTQLQYKSSAQFGQSFLPFPLRVVIKKIISTAQGASYQTDFEYRNGLWVPSEREFRGFGEVKEIRNDNGYSIINYFQDGFRQGRINIEQIFDHTNSLLFKNIFDWQTSPIIPGVQFIFLNRKDNFIYSSNGNKRTAETFSYDQYGNVLRLSQLGDVNESTGNDEGDDARIYDTAYVYNPSVGILGLPRQVDLKNSLNNVLTTKWLYYDGNNTNNQATPSVGLLTQEKSWGGTANEIDNPKTTYTYNVLGKVLTVTDPRLKVTTTNYENQFGIFPISVQNAKGHLTQFSYYGVNGVSLDDNNGLKGLWGQLKSVTDPNGQVTQTAYDGFGRNTLQIILPFDSLSFPSTTITYNETSSYRKETVRKRIKSGQPQTIETQQFVDGLGRSLQTQTPSSVAGEFNVTGQAVYNFRNDPVKQFLPFAVTGAIGSLEQVNDSRPAMSFVYDTTGRKTRKNNPDNTYATWEYKGRSVIFKDENGHQQSSELDAFGQLATKIEYSGADGRFSKYPSTPNFTPYATTNYKYDQLGNLTEVKDQDQNTTTIIYNKLGRKESMSDPDMGNWQYTYDLNGNLKTQTDAKGHTIFFDYDDLNRLISKTDDSGINNVYAYDDKPNSKGRLISVTFNGGKREFEYDPLGRQIQSTKTISGSSYIIKNNFDALNNTTDIEYPNQKKVFYQYNTIGQPQGAANDPSLLPQSFNLMKEEALPWWAPRKVKEALEFAAREVGELFTGSTAYAQSTIDFSVAPAVKADPTSKITVTPTCVSYASIETRTGISYVYRPVTTAGDFTYDFDTILSSGDTFAGEYVVWGATNTANATFNAWTDGFVFVWYKGGSSANLKLKNIGSTYAISPSLSLNQRYFIRVKRVGTTLTAEIYNNSSRTGTPLATLSKSNMATSSYSYLYAFSADNGISSNKKATGDSCNFLTPNPSDSQPPTAPLSPSLGGATQNSMLFSWSPSTDNVGVAGYRIDIATNSGFTTLVSGYSNKDVGSAFNTNITGLSPGTLYYGRVRAYDAAGNISPNSGTTSLATLASTDSTPPSAPINLNASNVTQNSFTISWNPSTDNIGVSGYRIDVATDNSFANILSGYSNKDVGNTTTTSIIGLSASTNYYVRVRAYDAAGNISINSGFLQVQTGASVDIDPPTVPTGLSLTDPTLTSLTLNWSASTDNVATTGYLLDVSTVATFSSFVTGYSAKDVANVTNHVISGLSSGTRYYARVRAYDALNNVSANSSSVNTVTLSPDTSAPSRPATPTITNIASNSFTLNWTATSDNVGVTGYRIEVSLSSIFSTVLAEYNNLDVGNVLSKSITGLSPSTRYYARVKAYDAAGNVSSASFSKDATTLAVPDVQAPTPPLTISFSNFAQTSLRLNWSGATDNVAVTEYRFDIATDSDFNNIVTAYNNKSAGTSSNNSITGLSPWKTYYGRVRAIDAAGNISSNSAVATGQTTDTQSPSNPNGLNITGLTHDRFVLNWNASTDNAGVAGYEIDVATNSTFTSLVSGFADKNIGNVTSFTVTGLSPAIKYYARLRAYDGAGNTSSNSSSINTTTSSVPSFALSVSVQGTGTGTIVSSVGNINCGSTCSATYSLGTQVALTYNLGLGMSFAGWSGACNGTAGCEVTMDAAKSVTATFSDVGAPSAPTNLSASAITTSSMNVGWTHASDNKAVTGYRMDVATDSSFNNILAGFNDKVLGLVNTTSISGLNAGTTYYIRIRAHDAAQNFSPYGTLTTTIVPGIPSGITLSPADGRMGVSWTPTQGATGYKVNFRTSTGSYLTTPQDTQGQNSWIVPGLTNGQTYYFKVLAYNSSGQGSYSAEQSAQPQSLIVYVSDIQYFPSGLKKRVALGNGVVTSYTYDANLRLKTITTTNASAAVIQNLSYEYDGVGNVTKITDGVSGETKNFLYDELNRLVQGDGNYGANQTYDILTFEYFPNGNIKKKDGKDYSYTPGNKPHAVRTVGTDTFTYDLNGNMQTKVSGGVTTTYTYNSENQLTMISSTGSQFAYDDTGDRIKKVFGSTTTRFVGDLYEDTNGATKEYVFVGGMRVAARAQGFVSFYHADHLGGTNAVTSESGAVVDRADYKPFGEFKQHTVPNNEGYYFTDQFSDAESGLYYYGARYYNPNIGRFITADTVVPDYDNSQSLNRYSYVLNNPIKYVDPLGHEYKVSGALWYDKLSGWADQVAETAKSYYFDNAAPNAIGIGAATAVTTAIDFGMGIFHYPAALGHLGEGTGTFIANPSLQTAPGMLMDVSSVSSVGAFALSGLPSLKSGISTPYGTAIQSKTVEAQQALKQVQSGATVYKGGILGQSETNLSQFLALENPLNVGYANAYGIPTANVNFNFVLTGSIRSGSQVITREAPGFSSNLGGKIEAVTNSGSFKIDSFYMP